MIRILIFALMITGQAQAESVNIRTSLASTFHIDRPNIRADFPVGEKLTLGGEVANQSYSDNGVGVKGFGGGLYATLHTKGVFNRGWTVDFGFTYTKLEGESAAGGVTRSGEVTNIGFRVLGGYHWFWEPFNLSLGFGYASNSEDKIYIRDAAGAVVAQADLKPVALAADLSIGLSF